MSNSIRRNTAFDLTKPEFVKPQNRLDANRWLNYATFGPATAHVDIDLSTKTTFVPLVGEVDDAVRLMDVGYEQFINEQFAGQDFDYIIDALKTAHQAYSDANGGALLNTSSDQIKPYLYGKGNGCDHIQNFFMTTALHSNNNTRLKLAYALSQIIVVGKKSTATNIYAEYATQASIYDSFLRATEDVNLPTYRRLLDEVTYSDQMSRWLTYAGNKKYDPVLNIRPDENYAREILQLFSIGLYHLNMDGSHIKDENGVDLETYNNDDIEQFAQVFTGGFINDPRIPRYGTKAFGYGIAGQYAATGGWNHHELAEKRLPKYLNEPFQYIPAQTLRREAVEDTPPLDGYNVFDVTADTFKINVRTQYADGITNSSEPRRYALTDAIDAEFNEVGVSVFAEPANGQFATLLLTRVGHGLAENAKIYIFSNTQHSVKIALDHVFNHPTTPPFIAKALIKFFVTSNPSPQFIQRVATVFVDNGNGVRGDLASVTKAILLDREAIVPFGINPENHGRYNTILDRLFRTARAFRNENLHVRNRISGATNETATIDGWFDGIRTYYSKPLVNNEYSGVAYNAAEQFAVLESPSVFNFYRPGYVPPGTILGDIGKTAPEMQVNTISSQQEWSKVVCALTGTEHDGASIPPDFQGNRIKNVGLDYDQTAGVEVTAKSGNDVTLTFTAPTETLRALPEPLGIQAHSQPYFVAMRRRSDGYLFQNSIKWDVNIPAGVGVKTFIIQNGTFAGDVLVGDVFDVIPFRRLPNGYLGENKDQLSGRVNVGPNLVHLYIPESMITNSVVLTNTTELNAVIDYYESILMSRPITQATRDRMIAIGSIDATNEVAVYANNDFSNFAMTSSQKRARRMLGVLLISPEYQYI